MQENKSTSVPTYDSMMNPLLEALHVLGGSGSINEINEKTIEIMGLPDEVVNIPHGDKGSRSEVEYRLAWSRTYLKNFGLLENSSRGVWALTKIENEPIKVDPREVVRKVREGFKRESNVDLPLQENEELTIEANDINATNWINDLKKVMLTLKPEQFERLAQRILRECGFTQVEVTGKSGDGGIDGKGIIKIAGLVSFHAMFQCKRYQDSITARHIRDFRGALQGRADKGLFITTGSFTRDAIKEAQRDGAPPIDLIDGEDLAKKLKELDLGVKIELVEKVNIDKDWFYNL